MLTVRSRRLFASCIAVALFFTTLTLLPSPGGSGVPAGPNPPLGVHLSYLDDPTKAVLTWHTAAAATSRAEWGTALGPPYPSQGTGTDYASAGGTHLHTVNLTGLVPGTKYYYRVGDAGMSSWFGQGSFRAAPTKGASDTFTFAAAGDWGNFTQTTQTSAAIAKRNPDLFLAAGDLYYSASEPPVRSVYEKWMQFGQGTFVMPAMGNHETDNSGNTNTPIAIHCAFSNLIGNERTYAFTWGNTFFVTMDWGTDTAGTGDGVDGTVVGCDGVHGTSAIRAWVDAKLAAANADPTIRWIVAYQHFPCYDTTTTGFAELCPTDGLPDQIEDILINRHVDLVLAGHDHTYGRTHPVHFKTVAQTGNAYDTPGYPIYFILGTGGQSGTGTCRVAPWVAACKAATPARGYGWFQVSPTMIRYEFVDNTGVFVDGFTLTKTPSVGLAVSADPSTSRIQPGETGSTNVTVLGTSANPVTLSLSGCPTAAICSFSSPIGTPRFTSALTVATTAATPEGNFRITITASNGAASATAPFDLSIAKRVTRTYQRGDGGSYSETDDAYIWSTNPNTNYGTDVNLFIDNDQCIGGQGICRSVLKFPQLFGTNTGQIPLGSRILVATLQLHLTNAGPTEDLYQLNEAWTESAVTWNGFATPGFPKRVERAFTFAPIEPHPRFLSLDVSVVVQNWAEGDPNYGFFLITASGDGADYDSSETSVLANRPKLTVTYEAPIQPSRDPRLWPFTSDSVWNLPIGSAANYIAAGIAQATAYGMTTDPDVLMLSPGAPITPVYLNSDAWSGGSRCDAQGGVLFEAPIPSGFIVPGANPTYTPNHAAAILDADGSTLIQGQPFTHCTANGNNTIWWYQTNERLNGTGLSGGHGGSNLSSIGGTIRLGELVPGGTIRHAMKVLLDAQANLYFNASTGGFRWPAMRADVCAPTCYGGANPALRMGSLLALPASVNVNTMGLETDAAKILARAFQDYGAYVVDNAAWSVYGIAVELSPAGNVEQEFANRWGFSMTPASKNVNWSRDMDRIFGALSVVDNWDLSKWQIVSASAGSLGAGLGAPRVAWAPPLGAMPVPSPFDFSLSTNPSSGLVSLPGGSVSTSVTAKRTFGPTHNLQYSCTNLPSGTGCSFTPTACSPTCTASVVFATSSSTLAGTYSVSIQATDGTITRVSGFTLTVGDPVLFYDMENLTADAKMKDLSGHGNHGTMSGTTDIAGRVGRARAFNGGERITAPAIPVPATEFTVAAWFRWTTNPSPYYSGIHGGGGSWDLRVMADGRFGATFYQSPSAWTDIQSPLVYNDGEWHHAAAALRGGLVELYVDGARVAQDTTDPITSVQTSTQLIAGQIASDFVGDIDEVIVYDRALSQEEIGALVPPPPSGGPVLQYDMENLTEAGWMKDLSGHGNHGTMSGTTDIAGRVGRARAFNGGERITAPAIPVPATEFTVAAWFRWTTNPSPYYSGIHGGGGSWDLRVMADGRFGATFYQSPSAWTDIQSPLVYNDGEWHHAAAALRNGLAEIYVDGVLKAFDTTNPISSTSISTEVQIGLVASQFVGGIDEVLVYDRALTGTEIAALVPPPPVEGLVLFYDMENLTEAGWMKDLSGHGNHGTMSGTTDIAGRVGRARAFNGGERITAPAIPVPATEFTVAAWFRWTTNPSPYYSGIHGGGGSWDLRVQADGALGVVFYQSQGPDIETDTSSAFSYNDGTWHHVAGILRSGLAELYVDGALVAQDTTNPVTSVRSSTLVEIGVVASWFVGDLDELRIFTRALTDQEIADLATTSAQSRFDRNATPHAIHPGTASQRPRDLTVSVGVTQTASRFTPVALRVGTPMSDWSVRGVERRLPNSVTSNVSRNYTDCWLSEFAANPLKNSS